jgi:outer membrane protein assembly factor BamB
MAAAYTLEGERRWLRQIEPPAKEWGHSTSPLFAGGRLLVHVKNMVGLNPETGQEVWRTPAASMWGTPVLARIGEEEVAICPGGEVIRAKDGKLLASKIHRLEYNAPVVQDGVVYGIDGAGGKANKLPAQAADTLQFESLWSNKPKNDRYYSSPAVKDGLIYAITRGRALSVFDAKDGQLVYEKDLKDLKGEAYPSITAAGKYLYVGVDGGQMLVLEGGREFKEVARNQLEPFRSSPVFAGNRMYLRTSKNFYCIGAAQP